MRQNELQHDAAGHNPLISRSTNPQKYSDADVIPEYSQPERGGRLDALTLLRNANAGTWGRPGAGMGLQWERGAGKLWTAGCWCTYVGRRQMLMCAHRSVAASAGAARRPTDSAHAATASSSSGGSGGSTVWCIGDLQQPGAAATQRPDTVKPSPAFSAGKICTTLFTISIGSHKNSNRHRVLKNKPINQSINQSHHSQHICKDIHQADIYIISSERWKPFLEAEYFCIRLCLLLLNKLTVK